jgi:hypothetical protein
MQEGAVHLQELLPLPPILDKEPLATTLHVPDSHQGHGVKMPLPNCVVLACEAELDVVQKRLGDPHSRQQHRAMRPQCVFKFKHRCRVILHVEVLDVMAITETSEEGKCLQGLPALILLDELPQGNDMVMPVGGDTPTGER